MTKKIKVLIIGLSILVVIVAVFVYLKASKKHMSQPIDLYGRYSFDEMGIEIEVQSPLLGVKKYTSTDGKAHLLVIQESRAARPGKITGNIEIKKYIDSQEYSKEYNEQIYDSNVVKETFKRIKLNNDNDGVSYLVRDRDSPGGGDIWNIWCVSKNGGYYRLSCMVSLGVDSPEAGETNLKRFEEFVRRIKFRE
ncbi:MAG: hypothetical protein CVU77_04290 [Elusimicrobia bacterium HGW-Elusimicrobia-1]|jgi:hypothetical protein|nr:MAG: hypothetical protein CVU77_04290 [Elusimicrobia bacterium HGW-Elusimicrobia-1]